ncbi:MAG: YigZ family protein [Bacteroidetes bacterium]|jgi:uncharacterized YigZ family protein|nr:YigZ family protein [Bacteroidota bacterium]
MNSKNDTYYSIRTLSQGEFKDKGSKFIAYVFPIHTEGSFQKELQKIQEEHPKARHFCTAFRLGPIEPLERHNDDGEPSGSAGRPILGQLHKFDVQRIGAIVVRYFGGTKLGVSGLIEAYKESTAVALRRAHIVQKKVMTYFDVQCSYAEMPHLLEAFKYAQVDIVTKKFDRLPSFQIRIPQSQTEEMWQTIATHFVGYKAHKENLIQQYDFIITPLKTD